MLLVLFSFLTLYSLYHFMSMSWEEYVVTNIIEASYIEDI